MVEKTTSSGSLLSFYVMLGLIAAVITKDIFVGFAVIVYGWIMGLCMLISVIPVVGVIIQYAVANSVSGMLISYLAIPVATVGTLLSISFWVAIVIGIVITCATTLIVIRKMR